MGTDAPRGSEKSQLEVSPANSRVRLRPSPRPSRSVSPLIPGGNSRLLLVLFEVGVVVEEALVLPAAVPPPAAERTVAPPPASAEWEGVVDEGAGG